MDQLARALFGAKVESICVDAHYNKSASGVRIDFDNGAKLWLDEFDVKAPPAEE
jgi:hypothetical protein